tara:strand:+ start:48803 stop:49003 length:201 start_codon:yes stop_codon:yes gene_type:complete
MKLNKLYEDLDVIQSSEDFYGDPKGKAKPKVKGRSNLSHLKGGHEDRDRFLNVIQGEKKKKKGKSK